MSTLFLIFYAAIKCKVGQRREAGPYVRLGLVRYTLYTLSCVVLHGVDVSTHDDISSSSVTQYSTSVGRQPRPADQGGYRFAGAGGPSVACSPTPSPRLPPHCPLWWRNRAQYDVAI